jgi:hypothetical protein
MDAKAASEHHACLKQKLPLEIVQLQAFISDENTEFWAPPKRWDGGWGMPVD